MHWLNLDQLLAQGNSSSDSSLLFTAHLPQLRPKRRVSSQRRQGRVALLLEYEFIIHIWIPHCIFRPSYPCPSINAKICSRRCFDTSHHLSLFLVEDTPRREKARGWTFLIFVTIVYNRACRSDGLKLEEMHLRSCCQAH